MVFRHTVEVSAESVLDAAALGLAAIEHEAWIDGPARGTTLEIVVLEPVVNYTVSVQQVVRWLDSVTTSPSERVKKERLKATLSNR
jgi:hypothetical protein